MSASETPKSRLETRSFPPVSMPAPPLPPAAPLKPLKPLSNMSCCHLSGSCLGCNRWKKRTCWLQDPPASVNHSPHGWVLGQAGAPHPTGPGCSTPPRGSPIFPAHPITTSKWVRSDRRTYTGHKYNKKDVLCTTYTYNHSIDFDVYNNVLRLYTFCYNSRIKIEHCDS